jgi:hypothetical protein
MSHIELADALAHNISDWLVFTCALGHVQRHQGSNVVFEALWLIVDDLPQSREEHVLLLLSRLLDHSENLLQEEVGIADRHASE